MKLVSKMSSSSGWLGILGTYVERFIDSAMKRIFSDGFFERTEIFLGRKDSTKKQIYDKNAIGVKVA